MTLIEASKTTRDRNTDRSTAPVRQALACLKQALRYWHKIADTPSTDPGDFLPAYRKLYSLANTYRDYVVKYEEELPGAVFQDALAASAELDGLHGAYYHGHGYHDPSWRAEADYRLRKVQESQARIERWLDGGPGGKTRRSLTREQIQSRYRDKLRNSVVRNNRPLVLTLKPEDNASTIRERIKRAAEQLGLHNLTIQQHRNQIVASSPDNQDQGQQ